MTARETDDYRQYLLQAVDYELNREGDRLKQDIWEKMGDELEVCGVPHHRISVYIQRSIEKRLKRKLGYTTKINTAHFYRVMRHRGWSNTAKSIAVNKLRETSGERVLSYAAALADGRRPNMTNELARYHMRQVREYVMFLEQSFLELADKDGKPVELADLYNRREITAFFSEITHMARTAAEAANRRTHVPVTAQSIMLDCMRLRGGLLNIGRLFLQTRLRILDTVRRKYGFLTDKQAAKYMDGRAAELPPLFRPSNYNESIYMGWYGLPCPDCKSWRSSRGEGKKAKVSCFDCGYAWDGYTVVSCKYCGYLFYHEDLRSMKENPVCPNADCGRVLRLPPNLLELRV